jgi:hypothetical protein
MTPNEFQEAVVLINELFTNSKSKSPPNSNPNMTRGSSEKKRSGGSLEYEKTSTTKTDDSPPSIKLGPKSVHVVPSEKEPLSSPRVLSISTGEVCNVHNNSSIV